MKKDLQGRSVVVTGAARGIGEKVARSAAARGARVGVVGLEPARLRALAEDLGPRPVWREANVRDAGAVRSAIDDCAAALGGIDYLVANAGVASYGTVRAIDDASFERVLDVNLNGVFRTLKYATPHLVESRGHALVVSSALAFLPLAAMAPYSASKAGVEMLTLAYRHEVAHLGVTAGLVHPSWIGTDLVRGAEADLPSFHGLRRRLPYPGNVTTTVDDAATAIVRALATRRARVYLPRAVGVANWAKALLNSPAAWPWTRRFAARHVPRLEAEVAYLGRHDQEIPPDDQPGNGSRMSAP